MTSPTDGPAKPNIPDQAQLSAAIAQLKKALANTADSSKSIIELGNQVNLADPNLASKLYWPDINKDATTIFQILRDEELFQNIVIALGQHFFDIENEILRQGLDSLLRTFEKIEDMVDGKTPGQYPSIPHDKDKRTVFIDRLKSFAEDYLVEYNSLARYLQDHRGVNFPWLTPIVAITTVRDNPYL